MATGVRAGGGGLARGRGGSVTGMSKHALLVDVAAKVMADNLAALLNRAVPRETEQAGSEKPGVNRQVHRSVVAKLLSRWIGLVLLIADGTARGRFMTGTHAFKLLGTAQPGGSRPRDPSHSKLHPSQTYKRAA